MFVKSAIVSMLAFIQVSASVARAVDHEQYKLTASDAAADDNFGHSVAIGGNVALMAENLLIDCKANPSNPACVFKRK